MLIYIAVECESQSIDQLSIDWLVSCLQVAQLVTVAD